MMADPQRQFWIEERNRALAAIQRTESKPETMTTITWEPQGDRYTRTEGNLEATLTPTADGWKYEVWDMGAATPKWVASGERRHMADAEAIAEQEMRSN